MSLPVVEQEGKKTHYRQKESGSHPVHSSNQSYVCAKRFSSLIWWWACQCFLIQFYLHVMKSKIHKKPHFTITRWYKQLRCIWERAGQVLLPCCRVMAVLPQSRCWAADLRESPEPNRKDRLRVATVSSRGVEGRLLWGLLLFVAAWVRFIEFCQCPFICC